MTRVTPNTKSKTPTYRQLKSTKNKVAHSIKEVDTLIAKLELLPHQVASLKAAVLYLKQAKKQLATSYTGIPIV